MAFLLIVIIEGEEINTKGMHFRDVNRCRYFADRLEDNEIGRASCRERV